MTNKTLKKWKKNLTDITTHASEMERTAIEAERDVDDLKKAEFMADKIGEVYTGIISSVTGFGLFIELDNTIEGLVHISNMIDDYYQYSEQAQALIGEVTKKIYRIGDEVEIEVTNVDMDEHAIDFKLVE